MSRPSRSFNGSIVSGLIDSSIELDELFHWQFHKKVFYFRRCYLAKIQVKVNIKNMLREILFINKSAFII